MDKTDREKAEELHKDLYVFWESFKELRNKFDKLYERFIELYKKSGNKLDDSEGESVL